MDDIAEQLRVRDRVRKAISPQMTYAQRLEKFAQLQQTAWHFLRASPNGYAHFIKRNFKARAIDVPDPNPS